MKPRNPFDLEDVPDPDGEDVQAFAAEFAPATWSRSPNVPQWAVKATAGKPGLLDGEWYSRWKGGTAEATWITGVAKVRSVGDRVFILHTDRTNIYLIEARREGKNRLVGRYVNTNIPEDISPWVGLVVDDERIDGIWRFGRWDLRRKLVSSVEKGTR